MFEKSRQDQSVAEGGQAIQAGRDVTVHHGMSPAQMAEVMMQLLNVTNRFTEEAMAKVDARVADFQDEILKRFTNPEKANSEAFRDPDFQYMLGQAQEAFARSGQEEVKETLADIISRRSKCESATREALALNDAALRAPKLTGAEFAALSLCYLIKNTHSSAITSAETMAEYINTVLLPFAREVSFLDSSFWHIEAQSCATIALGEVNLHDALRERYGGVLGKGLPKADYASVIPPEKLGALDSILCPAVRDPSKLQPRAVNLDTLTKAHSSSGLSELELRSIWDRFSGTIPNDLVSLLQPQCPDVELLFRVWQTTPIKSLQLNSVGIAIAHANAVRVVNFDAPLSIWLR